MTRIVALAVIALASPAVAADPEPQPRAVTISGGVTFASQYRFRGLSLSDEKPAVQGTINASHRSGLYAAAWASSLDGFGELGGSNVELDLMAGWKGNVAKNTAIDAGLLYYAYPGSRGGAFEFFEPYATVTQRFGAATASLGVNWAPSQAALTHHSNLYLHARASYAVPKTPVTLKAQIGRSRGDTPLSPNGGYWDWSVGADLAWRNLTLGVALVDTNINRHRATRAAIPHDIADRAAVVTLSASF